MNPSASAASIIVPTYREAANVKALVERVFAAMQEAGIEAELLLVDDDSRDGTDTVVESLQNGYPVRLIVRHGQRGLSSAVLAGFQEARHDRFVVLDADLQHPPELIPALLARLDRDECDFVIGTRYTSTDAIADDWPLGRRLASRVATLLARPLAPLSDPMSGFFALHRATWKRADPLNPIGYKIALELYVKGRCRRPAEVPIRFATRAAGKSKLNTAESWRYLRHLSRLYAYRFPKLTVLGAIGLFAAAAAMIVALIRATASG